MQKESIFKKFDWFKSCLGDDGYGIDPSKTKHWTAKVRLICSKEHTEFVDEITPFFRIEWREELRLCGITTITPISFNFLSIVHNDLEDPDKSFSEIRTLANGDIDECFDAQTLDCRLDQIRSIYYDPTPVIPFLKEGLVDENLLEVVLLYEDYEELVQKFLFGVGALVADRLSKVFKERFEFCMQIRPNDVKKFIKEWALFMASERIPIKVGWADSLRCPDQLSAFDPTTVGLYDDYDLDKALIDFPVKE